MNIKRIFQKKFWTEVSKLSKNEIKKKIIAKLKYCLGRLLYYLSTDTITILRVSKKKIRLFIVENSNGIRKSVLLITIFKIIKICLPKPILLKLKSYFFKRIYTQYFIRYLLDFSKSKKAKEYYSKRLLSYKDDSNVTAIVTTFNHDYTAEHVCKRLINNPNIDQIIICNDGSTDDSHYQYSKYLKDVNHFILTSNDLNTLRTIDRAARMARSKYLIVMQDDDNFPIGDNWLSNSLELFDRFKNLGLVGGWNFLDFKGMAKLSDIEINKLTFENFVDKFSAQTIDVTGPKFYFRFQDNNFAEQKKHQKHLKIDDFNNRTVQFVPACDIGPFVMNREFFFASGGVDFSWGRVGKSSCWWDTDLCYRFWKNGFSVINLPMHFLKGGLTIGSDHLYQPESKKETLENNLRVFLKKNIDVFEKISDTCEELNEISFTKFR